MSNTYDDPLRVSYQLNAASLATAAELATYVGPAGKQGRVESISALVTTAVTVAPSVVTVNDLANTVVGGSLSVPIGAVDTFANAITGNTDATLLPADSPFTIDTNGGATAGAANLVVVVAWF